MRYWRGCRFTSPGIAKNTSEILAEAHTEETQGTATTEQLIPAFEKLLRRLYDCIEATADDAIRHDFLFGIAYEIDNYTKPTRAHSI